MGAISCAELSNSETQLLRYVQSISYAPEIKDLKTNGKVKSSSSLSKLSPKLEDGAIEESGRLHEAPIPYRAKSPIILPR